MGVGEVVKALWFDWRRGGGKCDVDAPLLFTLRLAVCVLTRVAQPPLIHQAPALLWSRQRSNLVPKEIAPVQRLPSRL